jgi:glycine cleavage system H protein
MSNVPADLKYVESHEWLRLEGELATVGITDFAQSELGDVVFVELPEVGRILQKGDIFGQVESVKSVSNVYSPISGEVVEANVKLEADTSLINSDPYGAGFMIKLRVSDVADADSLLAPEAYAASIS